MVSFQPDCAALVPLAYHSAVVDYLRRHESEVWRWAAARIGAEEQHQTLRTELLRDTYRIEAQAHPDVHARLVLAMQRLGLSVPATLYQSVGPDMNAMLVYVPGEVHVIVQGDLLEKLSADEQLAVFGHELAHYLLWSQDDGAYFVADRILCDALGHAEAGFSLRETYRRYVLHTELFADRGAAVAAGSPSPAVSALVKLHTGMAAVDAAAYLRQAGELDRQDKSKSEAYSHPETFVRARALALWWAGAGELASWIESRLHGPLALEALDLPGQVELQALTRRFLAYFLEGTDLGSEAVVAQIRMLFPDWSGREPSVGPGAFATEKADDNVRHYLNALMLDLALADPDQQDAALLRAGVVATALDSLPAFEKALRRDAGFGKRELDRFRKQLQKEVQA